MGIWNALASVYGTTQSNKNIDKQLAAQSKENAAMRKYNLQLAKLQNQWNLQQWNLENAYNSPAAQMERLRQAGLNPDMMYGGGLSGNLSASSPEMTSGAAASPMDWSALGSKKTLADTLMKKAQIDNLNAQTEKTKSETTGQDIENKYSDAEHVFGLALTESEINLNRAALRETNERIKEIRAKVLNYDADTLSKVQQILFKQEAFQHEINKLAAEADMAKANADVAMKTIFAKVGLAQQEYEAGKARAEAAKTDADIKRFTYNKRIWDEFLKVVDRGIDIVEVVLDYKKFGELLKGEVIVTNGPKGTTITEKSKQ